MAEQIITDTYALYNSDCVEVMSQLPSSSIHFSIYSPPFGGLYHYSSDERDLSNGEDYESFFNHYTFVVQQITRLTHPGRLTAVHCTDIPLGNSGTDSLRDFPGDIIRLHEREGWGYTGRRVIWKEPLWVRNRTMQKNLAHMSLVEDAADVGVASADYLLTFRKKGSNKIPISNPTGLLEYAGEASPPEDVQHFRNWGGKQTENRFSHWIWRQYASSVWDDIRMQRVLPFRQAKDEEDEKHVHPLQLDVIERATVLWSKKGETVLTPFMGVGSEVCVPLLLGRKAVGIELKKSYFRQSVKNVKLVEKSGSLCLEPKKR